MTTLINILRTRERYYLYKLYCEDTEITIVGCRQLDLHTCVQKALDAMMNDEIIEPCEDWFEVIVSKVCEQNDFARFEPVTDGFFDVEEAYFREVSKREDIEQA